MKVYVLRDSLCGNGNDDPGQILMVHTSLEYLERVMKAFIFAQQDCHSPNKWRDFEIEGPFEVEVPST